MASPTTSRKLPFLLLLAVLGLLGLLFFGPEAPEIFRAEDTPPPPVAAAASPAAQEPTPYVLTWEQAIAQVEEVRGSPGRIEVPEALRHYDDRRRFLALQMAASEEEQYQLPHDQAELAQMIRSGEMVELRALSDTYILYDIGISAREDPLSHYDLKTEKDVPLFASAEAYQAEDAALAEAEKDRGPAGRRAHERRELLKDWYTDPVRADLLFREHAAITGLAANFNGRTYDLADPADRGRFQARLLSCIRPQARDVLLPLAQAYHDRFGRLLPVSSLVRTQRYQQRLARRNRNATGVDMPPHTTGMAFDISYKFMAPDEQNFLMQELARLEARGEVEALRERLNHFHVYVFEDGPPSERLVAGFLKDVEEAHPGSAPKARTPAKPAAKPAGRSPRSGRSASRAVR